MALAFCNSETNRQGKELVEHGTALLPVACYYDDLAKEAVPWHWHDELEAVVVTKGTAIVATEAENYTVTQGEGFFINAGILHAAWDRECSECCFHSVVFHPRLVGGNIDSVFWQNYIRPLIENLTLKALCFDCSEPWHQEAIKAVEEAWKNCVTEPLGYEFQIRSALSQLVLLLSNYHPVVMSRPTEKALRDGKRIKVMLQYIQEHFAAELNTARIAESAMISESECLRCFRNTIGTSPIQYVKQFRIQKAAELLIATEQKIANIGGQCGFQEMSYFTKTFRELKGCPPSDFRKKIAQTRMEFEQKEKEHTNLNVYELVL